jgi:hypothetical protein
MLPYPLIGIQTASKQRWINGQVKHRNRLEIFYPPQHLTPQREALPLGTYWTIPTLTPTYPQFPMFLNPGQRLRVLTWFSIVLLLAFDLISVTTFP